MCTISLTFINSAFCPHGVFMCFVWISEQTAITSIYKINWLVVIAETECVYCAVQTGYILYIYRVSQEECARLREGVPYVKVYWYNPKHLCPNLNGYEDNGQRKVWSSGASTHCTCQLTCLIDVCPWVWCPIQLTLAVQLCSRLIPECAVSHVTSVLAMHVSCIVLGTLRTTMTCVRDFL